MIRTWCRPPGFLPVLDLAQFAGLEDLLAEHLTVPSPNSVAKARSVVAGMLAGADSIEDLDLLRAGGMARVLGGVRAPSTLGTFLRIFTHGHVQQIDQVAAGVLAGLTRRVPALLAGGREADGMVFIDIDDTVREVHGYAKQAAAYGYRTARPAGVRSQPRRGRLRSAQPLTSTGGIAFTLSRCHGTSVMPSDTIPNPFTRARLCDRPFGLASPPDDSLLRSDRSA